MLSSLEPVSRWHWGGYQSNTGSFPDVPRWCCGGYERRVPTEVASDLRQTSLWRSMVASAGPAGVGGGSLASRLAGGGWLPRRRRRVVTMGGTRGVVAPGSIRLG